MVTLLHTDSSKSIEVQSGDTVVVRLDENPTTGFQWAIDKSNDAILTLQDSDYAPAPDSRVGSGGQRVFTFKAQSPGAVDLQLKLWRQWEGDQSITDRFVVILQIRG